MSGVGNVKGNLCMYQASCHHQKTSSQIASCIIVVIFSIQYVIGKATVDVQGIPTAIHMLCVWAIGWCVAECEY